MNSIFDRITKKDLSIFIAKCSVYLGQSYDISKAFQLAVDAIKYYNGDKSKRDSLREFHDLENKWYESLWTGSPDYSVYNDPYYLSDLWACWIVYSRQYLLAIKSPKSLYGSSIVEDIGKVKRIADLGNGMGMTTAVLKELFPKAEVIGTNIEGTVQYKLAKALGDVSDFEVLPRATGKIDLIFASEYFEHFERPVEHLIDILKENDPKAILTANSFNAISIGHFNTYFHNRESYRGLQISKLFNNTLRENGYEKVITNCWNQRPAYWRKKK